MWANYLGSRVLMVLAAVPDVSAYVYPASLTPDCTAVLLPAAAAAGAVHVG